MKLVWPIESEAGYARYEWNQWSEQYKKKKTWKGITGDNDWTFNKYQYRRAFQICSKLSYQQSHKFYTYNIRTLLKTPQLTIC